MIDLIKLNTIILLYEYVTNHSYQTKCNLNNWINLIYNQHMMTFRICLCIMEAEISRQIGNHPLFNVVYKTI